MSKDNCESQDPECQATWPGPSCPLLTQIVWWTDELFNWDYNWLCCETDPHYWWDTSILEDEDQAVCRRLGAWYQALSGSIRDYDAGE